MNYVVNPATITITGANTNTVYNGSAQTNSAASVSINGGSATPISGTTVNTGIGAQSFILGGTYGSGTNASGTPYADALTLTAAVGTTAGNYTVTVNQGALTIGKANAYVIIGSGQTSVYGATPVINYTYYSTATGAGGAAITSPLGLSGTATITNAPTSISNAATYALTYASGLSSTNYTFNPASSAVNYVVNPATAYIGLSSNTQSSVYGTTPSFSYSVYSNQAGTNALTTTSPTGTAAFTDVTAGTSTPLNSSANAGVYSNVSYVSGLTSTNYTFAAITPAAVYTINKAAAYVIIGSGQNSNYGVTPNIAYTLNSNNLGTGTAITSPTGLSGTAVYTNGPTATSNAGAYALTYASGLTSTNYNFLGTQNSVSYSVNGIQVYVLIGAGQSSTYGSAPVINYTFNTQINGSGSTVASPNGLVGSAVISNAPTTSSNAGTYNLTYASGLSSPNYIFNPGPSGVNAVAYTVNKAQAYVVVNDNQSSVYGTTPTINYTLSTAPSISIANTLTTPLGLGGTASFNSAPTNASNVATYQPAYATGLSSTNYSFAAGNGVNFQVTPATLAVTGTQAYNGTTQFDPSRLVIQGVNGQTFTATGTADLSTKNVQTNQQLATVGGLTLTPIGGALLSNYFPLAVGNTSVSVTPLGISLAAPANLTKVYDTSTAYTLSSADLSNMASGVLVGNDTISSANASFSNANAGTGKLVNLSNIAISDGNNGNNYTVTLNPSSTGAITRAALTIAANSDAKFVTQNDHSGYAGVTYGPFAGNETAAVLGATPTISRTNASINTAGAYSGVLVPSLTTANSNYQITYLAGNYTIVGANQLLVTVQASTPANGSSNVVTAYGTAANYGSGTTVTAQYYGTLNGVQQVINLSPTIVNNNSFSVDDGAGGHASFTIVPANAAYSGSSNLVAGGYNNLAYTGASVVSNNFSNNIVLIGGLTVN